MRREFSGTLGFPESETQRLDCICAVTCYPGRNSKVGIGAECGRHHGVKTMRGVLIAMVPVRESELSVS